MPQRIDDPILFDHGDFWSSEAVEMMTGDQVCAYLRLMCRQWAEGSIPADPRRIAAILTGGVRVFTAEDVVGDGTLDSPGESSIWEALAPCFVATEDGRLENPRVADERVKWLAKRESYRQRGKLGGRPKKLTESNEKAIALQQQTRSKANHNSVSVSSSVSKEEEDKTPLTPRGGEDTEGEPKRKRTKREPAEIPALLLEKVPNFAELWAERIRCAKGKAPNTSAERKQLEKLAKVLPRVGVTGVLQAVEKTTLGGYTGIFIDEGPRKPQAPTGSMYRVVR